jgi:putative ABC transport system permease protein
MDWRVLGFAALAGLTQVAVFGMIPGWRAARPDVMRILRGGGRSAGPASSRLLRNAVVVAEVALSFVLLVGAGLMFRSFLELRRVDPGYDSRGLLTFLLIGDARGFQPDERLAFLREIKQTLGAIPGVESVGASLALPLVPVRLSSGIQWGTEADPDPLQMADLPVVLPGYFETLRTRRVEGRTFTEQDNQPGRNVAIVDQLLADKAFPGQSAVGKRIFVNVPTPLWLDVIGVVAHQRLDSLADPGREQIYLTDGFFGIGISRHWALRTSGDPGTYAAAVRAEITRLAPGRLAVTKMETMETIVDRAQAGTRFHLLLIGLFGVIATLLAGVGLYGVLSGAVRQRTTEIGVRIAFGAQPGSIFGLVIGRGLLLTSIGLVLGLIAAFSLTRVMTTMLVGVRPTDPLTFAAMAVAFLLIAGVASWGPARRAASLDPMTVLRDE